MNSKKPGGGWHVAETQPPLKGAVLLADLHFVLSSASQNPKTGPRAQEPPEGPSPQEAQPPRPQEGAPQEARPPAPWPGGPAPQEAPRRPTRRANREAMRDAPSEGPGSPPRRAGIGQQEGIRGPPRRARPKPPWALMRVRQRDERRPLFETCPFLAWKALTEDSMMLRCRVARNSVSGQNIF